MVKIQKTVRLLRLIILFIMIWHEIDNKEERKDYGLAAMCLCSNSMRNEYCWLGFIVNSTQPRVNQEGITKDSTLSVEHFK